jgi:hypothetical protein
MKSINMDLPCLDCLIKAKILAKEYGPGITNSDHILLAIFWSHEFSRHVVAQNLKL